jgi:hypothetical protein
MEKPLINFRSKRNYLRYHYFYGNAYYYLQAFEFTLLVLVGVLAIDYLPDHQWLWDPLVMLLLVDGICCALTLVVLKLALNPPPRIWILVTLSNTFFVHWIAYGCLYGNDLRGLTLLISVFLYGLTASQVGRINLFPDRMVIYQGWRKLYTLFYNEIQSVQWSVEPVANRYPADTQKIPLIILTPIELETHGEDFTIYHYYVYIATKNQTLILQPLLYRSQFAQNAYNGWIEDFRWTGENVKLKMPPSSWEPKPHTKPYS